MAGPGRRAFSSCKTAFSRFHSRSSRNQDEKILNSAILRVVLLQKGLSRTTTRNLACLWSPSEEKRDNRSYKITIVDLFEEVLIQYLADRIRHHPPLQQGVRRISASLVGDQNLSFRHFLRRL
jgi:hypothetical protein